VAGEPIEQTYPAGGQQVWQALQQAIAELRYKDVREDPAAGTIEFRTGMSMWSWQGQQMTATVQETTPGQTRLSLTGGVALKIQATSWGEKKRIANKVLAEVGRRVGAPGPGAP
jgi:hypothetical protein